MDHYDGAEHINVGTGEDLVDPRAGRDGRATSCIPRRELRFDTGKPDGTPRKLLDVGRLTARVAAAIELHEGVERPTRGSSNTSGSSRGTS